MISECEIVDTSRCGNLTCVEELRNNLVLMVFHVAGVPTNWTMIIFKKRIVTKQINQSSEIIRLVFNAAKSPPV